MNTGKISKTCFTDLHWNSITGMYWLFLNSTLHRFKNYLFEKQIDAFWDNPTRLRGPLKFSIECSVQLQSSDDHLYCNIVRLLQSYHTLLQAFLIIYLCVCVFLTRIAERLIFRALTNEIKNKIFSFISEISQIWMTETIKQLWMMQLGEYPYFHHKHDKPWWWVTLNGPALLGIGNLFLLSSG